MIILKLLSKATDPSINFKKGHFLAIVMIPMLIGSCAVINTGNNSALDPATNNGQITGEAGEQNSNPAPNLTLDTSNNNELTCLDEQLFCVALVELGSGLDYFSIQAKNALERVEVDLTAQVIHKQITEEEASSTLEQLGTEHYDVIITIGDVLGQESITVYSKFSHSHFITVNQNNFFVYDNHLVELNFPEYEAGFLAGVLSALTTKSNVVAIVTPEESYSHQLGNGFIDGVSSISSAIQVIVLTELEGSTNPDKEQVREIVKNIVSEGADVVYAGGGEYGDMVLTEAGKIPSLKCIGMVADQWERLPQARQCLITSTIYQLELTLIDTMARIVLKPEDLSFHESTSGGFVGFAPFRDYDENLPADVKAYIFDTRDKLNNSAFLNQDSSAKSNE